MDFRVISLNLSLARSASGADLGALSAETLSLTIITLILHSARYESIEQTVSLFCVLTIIARQITVGGVLKASRRIMRILNAAAQVTPLPHSTVA